MSTPTNNSSTPEGSNMAQSMQITNSNTLKASNVDVVQLDLTLQLDFSYCYDEMLNHLIETGCFNEKRGLTRGGFSLESTNEHGNGLFCTEYSLDPSIKPDNFTSHVFEDDEEWEEYYEEYLRIENQANVLGVELIFEDEDALEQRLQARMDAVYKSMLSILQNDPMGYQYEDFDESGFILLSTTCGVVDYDHSIDCNLDGGEVADNYPQWDELYKEYQQITLEADQLNACLAFGP